MRKQKSLIKSYIIYINIILAFCFLLTSKRIKQNKEKGILKDTKEKSIDEIKKIIHYYKINKGLLRKLENKITLIISVLATGNIKILSNGINSEYDGNFSFFKNNPPDQVKLNNQNITYNLNADYLEIAIDAEGEYLIELI